ncbi:hypothetical protein QR680_000229 [Steinernema hermaphroditum]|uniref:Uncharacterized protein n=1 Tax=Steinernema hermaphroditum TaxID=289476 RepID=A0AA39GTX2_9BILA|nr:hypothetical protein QR680_000229 [Steinernema hermaphroditum]
MGIERVDLARRLQMFRLLARCSLNTQAHRINSLLKFPVVTEEILMFYERCQLTPSQMDSMHWLISYYLYVASVHESLNRMFHYFYFGHGELIPSRFKTLFIQCAWKHFEQFLHASKNQLLSLLVMLNDVELSTRQEDLKLLDTVAISHGHLPIDRLDFPYYEGALPGIGYIWKDISMVKTNRRVPREIKRGRCVFKILVDPLPEKVYRGQRRRRREVPASNSLALTSSFPLSPYDHHRSSPSSGYGSSQSLSAVSSPTPTAYEATSATPSARASQRSARSRTRGSGGTVSSSSTSSVSTSSSSIPTGSTLAQLLSNDSDDDNEPPRKRPTPKDSRLRISPNQMSHKALCSEMTTEQMVIQNILRELKSDVKFQELDRICAQREALLTYLKAAAYAQHARYASLEALMEIEPFDPKRGSLQRVEVAPAETTTPQSSKRSTTCPVTRSDSKGRRITVLSTRRRKIAPKKQQAPVSATQPLAAKRSAPASAAAVKQAESIHQTLMNQQRREGPQQKGAWSESRQFIKSTDNKMASNNPNAQQNLQGAFRKTPSLAYHPYRHDRPQNPAMFHAAPVDSTPVQVNDVSQSFRGQVVNQFQHHAASDQWYSDIPAHAQAPLQLSPPQYQQQDLVAGELSQRITVHELPWSIQVSGGSFLQNHHTPFHCNRTMNLSPDVQSSSCTEQHRCVHHARQERREKLEQYKLNIRRLRNERLFESLLKNYDNNN